MPVASNVSRLSRWANSIGHALGSARRGFSIGARVDDWEGAEVDRFRRRPRGQRIGQDETLDYGVREDLLGEARDLCNKQGICNRIIRQYANYVVGDCQARWITADAAWNKLAEQAFYDWSLNCDLKSTITLKQKAKMHMMGLIRDGDSFAVKVDFDGEPKIKDIEADRVGNYLSGNTNHDEDRIVGGIKIDAIGRPMSYLIWERTRCGQFKNVDQRKASEVLHLYDSTRFDAYRGVTHFAPVLNHLRDLKETVAAQKAKQKLTSKLALMVRNALGGPQAGNIEVMSEDIDKATGASILTESFGEGGAIKYQFHGDEMEAFVANDPSDGWFRLTEYLLREIGVGLDLPFEFIWTMAGITGPGTRMMSKQAERTFRGKQDILETRFLNPVTAWWVNFEMQPGGKLPFNDEWHKFKFQRPAHISIDAGRDSSSNLNELGAGVSTEGRIAEEQGEDDEEVADTRKAEVRRKLTNAREIAEEFQISLTEALNLLGRSHVPTSQTITTDDLDKVNAPVHNPIPATPGEARHILDRSRGIVL
jgi:capsid protein